MKFSLVQAAVQVASPVASQSVHLPGFLLNRETLPVLSDGKIREMAVNKKPPRMLWGGLDSIVDKN